MSRNQLAGFADRFVSHRWVSRQVTMISRKGAPGKGADTHALVVSASAARLRGAAAVKRMTDLRVRSINVSGHKFGLVYPGIGWLVFRETSDLPEDLVFYENYLGNPCPLLPGLASRNSFASVGDASGGRSKQGVYAGQFRGCTRLRSG
jgi:hypothetical protein